MMSTELGNITVIQGFINATIKYLKICELAENNKVKIVRFFLENRHASRKQYVLELS